MWASGISAHGRSRRTGVKALPERFKRRVAVAFCQNFVCLPLFTDKTPRDIAPLAEEPWPIGFRAL